MTMRGQAQAPYCLPPGESKHVIQTSNHEKWPALQRQVPIKKAGQDGGV